MWVEKKNRRVGINSVTGAAHPCNAVNSIAFKSMRTYEQAEVYFGRCDQAAEYLMKGKKVSIHLEVLGQFGTDVKQWLVDLHNAIAVECYDPADCLEDSCGPEYKLSVLVKNGKAIASAKRVN